MVLKNYVCMCASMCLLKYLVVSLEGKSQELPTISAPIQPVTAPITITICKFPFQFQIQRERERETLGREEAEEGGGLQGEWTDMPSCSSSLGFPALPPLLICLYILFTTQIA